MGLEPRLCPCVDDRLNMSTRLVGRARGLQVFSKQVPLDEVVAPLEGVLAVLEKTL